MSPLEARSYAHFLSNRADAREILNDQRDHVGLVNQLDTVMEGRYTVSSFLETFKPQLSRNHEVFVWVPVKRPIKLLVFGPTHSLLPSDLSTMEARLASALEKWSFAAGDVETWQEKIDAGQTDGLTDYAQRILPLFAGVHVGPRKMYHAQKLIDTVLRITLSSPEGTAALAFALESRINLT